MEAGADNEDHQASDGWRPAGRNEPPKMPHGLGPWCRVRQLKRGLREDLCVFGGMIAPEVVPPVEMLEFDPEDCRRNRVKALVPAFNNVRVLAQLAEVSEQPYARGEFLVVGRDGDAISIRA